MPPSAVEGRIFRYLSKMTLSSSASSSSRFRRDFRYLEDAIHMCSFQGNACMRLVCTLISIPHNRGL
jgi:hypothetical protein